MLDEQGGKCGCILDDNFMHSWHIKILYMSVSFSYKIKMFLNKFALISNYSMYHKLILSSSLIFFQFIPLINA